VTRLAERLTEILRDVIQEGSEGKSGGSSQPVDSCGWKTAS